METEYIIRRNPVLETLRGSRRTLHGLWLQEGLDRKTAVPFLQLANARRVPVKRVSKQKLGQMARDGSHQGVLLAVGPYVYSELGDMLALAAQRQEKPFLLLLDLLHGPQNIGQLLRTAEIVGVHGIVMQDRRAPDVTPAVVQYSAGAAEHLHVAQVTNLGSTIQQLQADGIWVIGMDMGEDARRLGDIDLDMPLAVVVGHEGQGLRRLVRQRCDVILQLPMRGHVESLNAAVAGSILLYAAWQARGFSGA